MITFHQKERVFHLTNGMVSMVLTLRDDAGFGEELLLAHFGAPITDPAACVVDVKDHASVDIERSTLPYACPADGRGDYRPCMLRVRDARGYCCAEPYYASHEIVMGKPPLSGLPATYAETPDEAETLIVTLKDSCGGLTVEMIYTIFKALPVIAASARYQNGGTETLTLENAASLCLTLPGRYDMLHLHGAWARERHIERSPAARITRMIESCRGASGHEHNPFAVLMDKEAGEQYGECFGVNLVYSGDFRISVDENAFGTTRLIAGLNPRAFRWALNAGESLQAPEAVCAYSRNGLNGMSHAFHELYRTRLCRGYWRDRARPVLLNSWEATYFDFDHQKLVQIAKQAASLGVELFVLDDGWFGRRDLDNCSLGDWTEDRRKLPKGLSGLAAEINALGMRFGLWMEPEMVSPDSDLYRAHPDWCLHIPGRRCTEARNQLVLDLSRAEVQEYIIASVSRVLSSAPIEYIKWDMNRNFTEVGSALTITQGEVAHRYMLGLYHILETITSAFPRVLFESCASGGGRFDPGMLYYMPQTWTSDDTDAAERLYIQYGTSLCYPASAMSAHVSASPNHQIGRVTSLSMRGNVALSGNFGYELNPLALNADELMEIKKQIAFVKAIRETTQKGSFTRLASSFEGRYAAWQFADDHRLILCVFHMLAQPNAASFRVRLRDLPAGARYQDSDGKTISSETLMGAGICSDLPNGDFSSRVWVWNRI